MNPLVNKDSPIWALEDSSWNYYLDLEPGDIITTSALKKAEDEEDLDSTQYHYITILPWQAHNHIVSFIETRNDEKVQRHLPIAIDVKRPISKALQDYPEQERWIQYHKKRYAEYLKNLDFELKKREE